MSNPTGNSVSPFNNASDGAVSLGDLLTAPDAVVLTSVDTVYFVGDNGDITETVASGQIAGTLQKDPASTNKPVLNIASTNGILQVNADNVIIKDLIFNQTHATSAGLTIRSDGSTGHRSATTIDSCEFRRPNGGGTVECIISNGTGDDIVIKNNIFNECGGKAIFSNVPYTPTGYEVINNSFYNCATSSDEVIDMEGHSGLIFKNNIISGGGAGGGRNLASQTTPDYDYNIVHNVTGTAFLGEAQGGNEITSDPLFTTPGSDFSLQSGSPARNGGTTTTATVDFDGVSRPQESVFDMGALEFEVEVPVITCWKYTAPYKGSNRLFTANGPDEFPANLKVPKNVDISKGVMIDEGQLIDPGRFNIEQ